MSLFTQMIIADRYGARLGMEQLAEVLGIKKSTLYNQISAGTCPVTTYLDGGLRFCDYRDVSAHLDSCRKRARDDAGLPA